MAEVVVTIAGVVLFRYAEHSAGVAPETANARAAVTHALADAIAALAALPVPCPHQDLLRQIGQRLEALDTPDARIACRDLDQSTRGNLEAINRALSIVSGTRPAHAH